MARYSTGALSESASAALTSSELMALIQTATQTIQTASAELAHRSKSKSQHARISSGDRVGPSMDVNAEPILSPRTSPLASPQATPRGKDAMHRAALWEHPSVPSLDLRNALGSTEAPSPPKQQSTQQHNPRQPPHGISARPQNLPRHSLPNGTTAHLRVSPRLGAATHIGRLPKAESDHEAILSPHEVSLSPHTRNRRAVAC